MFSIPTPLTPYTFWIKLVGVLIVIAAIAGGGYWIGSNVAHATDAKALHDMQDQRDKVQKAWDADKVVWADTKTRMAVAAAAALKAHDDANNAKEAADQLKIASLTTKYQQALKDVQNAKATAIARDTHPAPGSDDGLWVDVDTDTCAGYPDGRRLVSQAGGVGPLADRLQCRLSASTAQRLDEEAAAANEVVAHYNECVGHLGVATQDDPLQKTTITTDTQGATQ